MIPQEDLLVSPTRLYKKLKEYLDKYRNDIETKDTFYYNCLLEQIRNTGFWNLYSASEHICEHVYRRGKKEGQICGAKFFIKTNDKLQKYLCSRHCRNYDTKPRKYTINNPRCNYERKNGEQCKHRSLSFKTYCYIHIKYKNENKNKEYMNSKINKLRYLRKLYYRNKYKKKRKYRYNHINKNYSIIYSFKEYIKNKHKHILMMTKKNENIFHDYIFNYKCIKRNNNHIT